VCKNNCVLFLKDYAELDARNLDGRIQVATNGFLIRC